MGDRVCFFGDGIYDATYSRNYTIFSLDEHVDRFYNSAKLLEIELPYSKTEMKDLLNSMVKKMDTGENFVYFQATRGSSSIRNHVFPNETKANIWINIYHKEILDLTKRIQLITMEDTRFFHCNIKTLNLIPAVIASQRAKEAGCFESRCHCVSTSQRSWMLRVGFSQERKSHRVCSQQCTYHKKRYANHSTYR